MNVEFFLFILATLFAAILVWAFRVLPREQWQIIAAVPRSKTGAGVWQGLNLTFYGFFQATSNTLAAAILFLLLGAVGVTTQAIFTLILILFLLCWPASKLIARVVEKKRHTFTVGGAVFVGVLAMPWIIEGLNRTLSEALGGRIPAIPALAGAAIAYAYGEGLGRLGCISFGCCYGKSVDELSPCLRGLFNPLSFTFMGTTKKAAYEGRLEGVRVVPIQAITSLVFIIIALVSTYLFLKSYFATAMLFAMTATQFWRFLSEMLRADVRSKTGKISAYQVMALSMVLYTGAIAFAFPNEPTINIALTDGLNPFWNPVVLLFCQILWLVVFLVTGRSSVTGSTLTFFVRHDRI